MTQVKNSQKSPNTTKLVTAKCNNSDKDNLLLALLQSKAIVHFLIEIKNLMLQLTALNDIPAASFFIR